MLTIVSFWVMNQTFTPWTKPEPVRDTKFIAQQPPTSFSRLNNCVGKKEHNPNTFFLPNRNSFPDVFWRSLNAVVRLWGAPDLSESGGGGFTTFPHKSMETNSWANRSQNEIPVWCCNTQLCVPEACIHRASLNALWCSETLPAGKLYLKENNFLCYREHTHTHTQESISARTSRHNWFYSKIIFKTEELLAIALQHWCFGIVSKW